MTTEACDLTAVSERPGLHDLDRVALRPEQERAMERLRAVSLGSAAWRARKQADVRDLMALEQLADRMSILAIDPTVALRAVIELQTPVPCMPPGATDIVVESRAVVAFFMPEQILSQPLPGPAVVDVLEPRHVFLANVGARGPAQPLCLGANIPRGYPLREAVLATYATFTMQSVASDERDTAGIMRDDAAIFWQRNSHRIPLSSEPFLASSGAEVAS